MWLRALTLTFCLLGSLAHPAPRETTDISQRDVPSLRTSSVAERAVPSAVHRPKKTLHRKLPELNWSASRRDEIVPRSDISARDVGDFDRYTFLALRGFAVANAGVQIFNIVEDCREFGESKRNAMNCIWASFATVLGFAVMVDRAVAFRGNLAERLDASSWHVPGISKREEIPQLEGQLSSLLSAEVRHVGIWDGKDGDDDDGENSALPKRDIAKVPRHVFGANFHGTDMHFTYMGDVNNASHFRFGHGPGPDTENNRRRRSRRTHKYNNQYFDNGGLDFIARTDPNNDNDSGIYIDADDSKEFNWLVEQVACYLSSWDPIRGSPMTSNGVNFQIFNSWDRTTLAAGAIAPFTKTRRSAIRQMKPKDGIHTIGRCTRKSSTKSRKQKPKGTKSKYKPKKKVANSN